VQTRTEKLATKFRACEEQINKVQVDKETKTKVVPRVCREYVGVQGSRRRFCPTRTASLLKPQRVPRLHVQGVDPTLVKLQEAVNATRVSREVRHAPCAVLLRGADGVGRSSDGGSHPPLRRFWTSARSRSSS